MCACRCSVRYLPPLCFVRSLFSLCIDCVGYVFICLGLSVVRGVFLSLFMCVLSLFSYGLCMPVGLPFVIYFFPSLFSYSVRTLCIYVVISFVIPSASPSFLQFGRYLFLSSVR